MVVTNADTDAQLFICVLFLSPSLSRRANDGYLDTGSTRDLLN